MDLDPKLIEQIREAGDHGEVEALLLVAEDHPPGASPDDRGPAGQLIDCAIKQTHEKPSKVRFMPKLGAVLVRGSGRLIRQLLDSDKIISASANQIEAPNKPLGYFTKPFE